ncbi:hypothetical protein SFA35_25170 (plasmid) [Pseudomonas sp. HR96]|uniref:hypothetical protein n=1 Tax=Pseudomonas sp. HR96 TaxID=1027966 RepID=UPI002A7540BB|nr:hypothetical protein [Pseudomonas sp. HR96]WPP02461.1 hypothetical protein SFA35_25170 [Pseudomonas sp. HR96]
MSIPYLPLERWQRLWIVENGLLRCRQCGALLREWQARKPFIHYPGCAARGADTQYPLRDLMNLRQAINELGLPSE